MAQQGKVKVVVTGGSGFLGGALVRALLRGGFGVVSVSRRKSPELEKLGASCVSLDLTRNITDLKPLLTGAKAVFHAAAKVDMWGRYDDFYAANVLATQNLLNACVDGGVEKFIFTSSPSVVADGNDLCGIDESYPYPKRHMAYYPMTKAAAEKAVIAADSPNGLRTVSLRPHLIFGPGDSNLIPTILQKAKSGRLKQVGVGENLTDLTYIEDCVEAHLCALKAMDENPEGSCGRPFFISQGEPVKMWPWINEVLQLNGLPLLKGKINARLAYLLATGFEALSNVLPGRPEPFITRFLVCEMSTSHYFNINAARKVLGFNPRYSVKDAMRLTFQQNSRAES